jgi:hypothetical protein
MNKKKGFMINLKLFGLIILMFHLNGKAQERLIYHEIVTDNEGKIIPWHDNDPGKSFDHVINLVWSFWDTMRIDLNGLPYYMNHQVWEEKFNDRRGIGGDQLQMALSAWRLLYAYSGNERVKVNMCFMADYYLSHSLSKTDDKWPDIPYPYNTLIYSGIYDGDMVIGKDFTQPDKAGSFGFELVNLYKITGLNVYLDAAIKIANTLALQTDKGDYSHSPLPFKVNAVTGEVGTLIKETNDPTPVAESSYTSNWAPTLSLFLELRKLKTGQFELYGRAIETILQWMKEYPLKNNRWGPFFEDVPGWSDTQINAMTFARFIMEHREYFPDWKENVKSIIDWVYQRLGNKAWENYGVIVINEQTAYEMQGNSHTARQGSDELLYCKISGDNSRYENAVRQLIWSTYMVNDDGRNRYPNDENWLTDGYGDYVRHYLRAMAAEPALAPADENHILSSTSVVRQADYHGSHGKALWNEEKNNALGNPQINYRTFDKAGTEVIRLIKKPTSVMLGEKPLTEKEEGEGYSWMPLESGGILKINRINGYRVQVLY